MEENFKRPFWVVHRPSRSPNLECMGGKGDGKSFVFLFTSEAAANKARANDGGAGAVKELLTALELRTFLQNLLTVGIDHVAVDHGGEDVKVYPVQFVLKSIED